MKFIKKSGNMRSSTLTFWLGAFRSIYENNSTFILFFYEVKLNLMPSKFHLTFQQKNFFAHGIRVSCMSVLEKGKAWASAQGCIALYGENSPCKNTYQIMEEVVLYVLRLGLQ